jgi:hypothetical protein
VIDCSLDSLEIVDRNFGTQSMQSSCGVVAICFNTQKGKPGLKRGPTKLDDAFVRRKLPLGVNPRRILRMELLGN